MTRKDYELIAESLRESYEYAQSKGKAETIQMERLILQVTSRCCETNERFDEEKFLKACGL